MAWLSICKSLCCRDTATLRFIASESGKEKNTADDQKKKKKLQKAVKMTMVAVAAPDTHLCSATGTHLCSATGI